MLLLGGKNARKLWDPKNLALKCEGAIIIGSERQNSNKKHKLERSQRSSYQTATQLAHGSKLTLKGIINAACMGSLSEFNIQVSETKEPTRVQLDFFWSAIMTFVQF